MQRRTASAAAVALLAATAIAAPKFTGGSDAHAATARPTITINLGEFFFRPSKVTVHVGQPVRFVNIGKIDHTVADIDRHWNIRSQLIKPHPLSHGQTQTVTFHHTGTVYYLCTFHPTLMRGRITVIH
jgi:plastocyanin